MSNFTLYIGNKAYSSWSLRGWMMMKQAGVPFDEVVIPLEGPGTRTAAIRPFSPSGKVPALHHGDVVVWESLAIGEYLAELFPHAKLWPAERPARAIARAVSAEMLGGFAALRAALPMNVRRKDVKLSTTPAVNDEIARIVAIWADCRHRFGAGGPFLFGSFGIADAMFTPVATRFRTYGVDLDAPSRAYVDAVMSHPHVQEWIAAARHETWTIEPYERLGT